MVINPHQVADLLHKHIEGTGFLKAPIKVEHISEAVRAITTVEEVKFKAVPDLPSDFPVKGKMVRYRERQQGKIFDVDVIEIQYLRDDHPFMQRMAISKELCQVFWSEDKQTRTPPGPQLQTLILALEEAHQGRPVQQYNPAYAAEQLALVAAMELLCPFFYRERMLARVEKTPELISKISDGFQIPDDYVRILFTSSWHLATKDARARRNGDA